MHAIRRTSVLTVLPFLLREVSAQDGTTIGGLTGTQVGIWVGVAVVAVGVLALVIWACARRRR